jgi:amino acid transporter
MASSVSVGLSPLVRPTADGGEDDDLGLAQPGDNLLADDAAGASLVEAENADFSRPLLPTGLNFFSAYALVVGSIIGAGIFASPSRVDSSTPSPGVAMLVWLAAGLVAWAGAVAFAELGAAIPRNGGMQEYLRYIYGDSIASVMSRTWILASRPGGMSLSSLVFAEYWTTMILPSGANSEWATKILAFATVLGVLMMNCFSVSVSTRFTNLVIVSKLSTVALVLIMALLVATFHVSSDGEPNRDWSSRNWFAIHPQDVVGITTDWTDLHSWKTLGHLTSAMYAALWAYSGFDSVRLAVEFMEVKC